MELRLHNVILLGANQVGKRSLISQYCYGEFPYNNARRRNPRGEKDITIDGKPQRIQLCDFSFDELEVLSPECVRDIFQEASSFLLVYDITSESSFQAVQKPAEAIEKWRGPLQTIWICGNKRDAELQEDREVTEENGRSFAASLGCAFAEISVKKALGLNGLFTATVMELHDLRAEQERVAKEESRPCWKFRHALHSFWARIRALLPQGGRPLVVDIVPIPAVEEFQCPSIERISPIDISFSTFSFRRLSAMTDYSGAPRP